VKYVLMDFPLESIHKQAFKAAEAVRCAGEQGKYWEMHDRLLANQKTLEPWTPHAEAVGLDVARFDRCMSAGKFAGDIRNDVAQGQGAGVGGTPGFFLAVTDTASSKVRPLRFVWGAQPFGAFKAEIDAVLTEQGGKGRD
jgi:protein-disulfide isomerase